MSPSVSCFRPLNLLSSCRIHGNAVGCYLFLNERDSDVSISVKWEDYTWHLPAHRLILSAVSEVFRKMFDIDMIEKTRGKITITDCSPLIVKQFLKYIYMGALDFRCWTEAAELLKIAHKYGVHALTVLCENHLTTALTFTNVCYLYETALTYSLQALEKKTADLIQEAAFIVSATEGFLNLKPKSLEYFLKSDLLIVENEYSVLVALREWAMTSCSRKDNPLTRENILHEMKPFMKYIKWSMIPITKRTFFSASMLNFESTEEPEFRRKNFYVAASLQHHINILKFVVELGAFYEEKVSNADGLMCLKFCVDNHAFVAGFRIVGMFWCKSTYSAGASLLTLSKDDNRTYTQFNLNSLPWAKGTKVGDYTWRELTAYLPFPVRIDPFSTYTIKLKYNSRRESNNSKWPYTRLDSGLINTSLGNINFHCCSESYGITQLFMLPAPPPRNVFSQVDSYTFLS